MAINDGWNYTRVASGLGSIGFTVYGVTFASGEARARAVFYHRTDAEHYAANTQNGPGQGIAVEDPSGFVIWTSF